MGEEIVNVFSALSQCVFFLSDRGHLYGLGDNGRIKLALGEEYTQVTSPTLIKVFEDQRMRKATGGTDFSVFLSEDGKVWSVGKGLSGQLGLNKTSPNQPLTPIDTSVFDGKVVNIACGGQFTLFQTDRNTLYSCGMNKYGELGRETQGPNDGTPARVNLELKEKIVDMQCGYSHTILLTESGTVYGFGSDREHQIGTGEQTSVYEPRVINVNSERVFSIECGLYLTYFITHNEVYYSGKLGVHNPTDCETITKSHITEQIPFENIQRIACAWPTTYVLTKQCEVYKLVKKGKLVKLQKEESEHDSRIGWNFVASSDGLYLWFKEAQKDFHKVLSSNREHCDVDFVNQA